MIRSCVAPSISPKKSWRKIELENTPRTLEGTRDLVQNSISSDKDKTQTIEEIIQEAYTRKFGVEGRG